jgi:hypothetical protein
MSIPNTLEPKLARALSSGFARIQYMFAVTSDGRLEQTSGWRLILFGFGLGAGYFLSNGCPSITSAYTLGT